MYYIYFPFVLILSGLMLSECRGKKHPKWWAAMVFIAPVTTPYFIFKSRKTEGMILFMVFMITFMVVSVSEFYIYSNMKEKYKYNNLPPITRQIIQLSDDLKTTTFELDRALGTLEHLSKVDSRIKELKHTIEFIETLRTIFSKNQFAINQLNKFIFDHKSYLAKKNLNWVYGIQQFYTNRNVMLHYNSLETYVNDFQALLKYSYTNFYNITEHKTQEHLKNYDEYYLRYRRAVDAHNTFNVQRIEFQNKFLLKYPDLKPYLPGERQTETFSLWE
ncbi:MAG: hypothetical protein PF503_14980 [Desulfobacula sp.]|nr:hypothetical protein [Desulfobacula sp.]